MAYYPFLSNERSRVKALDVDLEELSTNPMYAEIIENAVRDIEGREHKTLDRDLAVMEFVVVRILLGIINDPPIEKAYIKRKSEEYRRSLEREDLSYLIKMAREEFGMDIRTEGGLRIHFTDFLKHKPEFLNLAQMELEGGYVSITKEQLVWILKDAIAKLIESLIPRERRFPSGLVAVARRIRLMKGRERAREAPRVKRLKEEALPPCIRSIIEEVEAGKSSHSANFVLATFLLGLGLKDDDVINIFKRSPKYKEKTTVYQIRFMRERGYTCPGCESIRSYGLCKWECKRKHPVSNYFLNLRSSKNERE